MLDFKEYLLFKEAEENNTENEHFFISYIKLLKQLITIYNEGKQFKNGNVYERIAQTIKSIDKDNKLTQEEIVQAFDKVSDAIGAQAKDYFTIYLKTNAALTANRKLSDKEFKVFNQSNNQFAQNIPLNRIKPWIDGEKENYDIVNRFYELPVFNNSKEESKEEPKDSPKEAPKEETKDTPKEEPKEENKADDKFVSFLKTLTKPSDTTTWDDFIDAANTENTYDFETEDEDKKFFKNRKTNPKAFIDHFSKLFSSSSVKTSVRTRRSLNEEDETETDAKENLLKLRANADIVKFFNSILSGGFHYIENRDANKAINVISDPDKLEDAIEDVHTDRAIDNSDLSSRDKNDLKTIRHAKRLNGDLDHEKEALKGLKSFGNTKDFPDFDVYKFLDDGKAYLDIFKDEFDKFVSKSIEGLDEAENNVKDLDGFDRRRKAEQQEKEEAEQTTSESLMEGIFSNAAKAIGKTVDNIKDNHSYNKLKRERNKDSKEANSDIAGKAETYFNAFSRRIGDLAGKAEKAKDNEEKQDCIFKIRKAYSDLKYDLIRDIRKATFERRSNIKSNYDKAREEQKANPVDPVKAKNEILKILNDSNDNGTATLTARYLVASIMNKKDGEARLAAAKATIDFADVVVKEDKQVYTFEHRSSFKNLYDWLCKRVGEKNITPEAMQELRFSQNTKNAEDFAHYYKQLDTLKTGDKLDEQQFTPNRINVYTLAAYQALRDRVIYNGTVYDTVKDALDAKVKQTPQQPNKNIPVDKQQPNSTENPNNKPLSQEAVEWNQAGAEAAGSIETNAAVTTAAADPVAGDGYNYQKAMKKKLNQTTYTYTPSPNLKIVRRTFD